MGYIVRNIAEYTDPAPLSIVARPNFFILKGIITQLPVNYTRTLRFKQDLYTSDTLSDAATVVLALPDGSNYDLRPTLDLGELGGTMFFVDTDAARTAENIKNALMSLDYIRTNFDVNIFSINTIPYTGMQSTIQIVSKGQGAQYNPVWKDLTGNVDPSAYWAFTGGAESHNYDMVTGDNETAQIEVDVYTGSSVLLGLNDFPDTAQKLGQLVTVLQKNYIAGGRVWFDINGLFSKSTQFNYDISAPWFNPNTLLKYRFDVRLRDSRGTYTIYRSNIISALNGFAEITAPDFDLYEAYVYTGAKAVRQLTNQPQIMYVPGQPVFLNFMIGEPARKTPPSDEIEIGVRANFYTQAGVFIDAMALPETITLEQAADVNTFRVQLDSYVKTVQDNTAQIVGLVKLCVTRAGIPITNYTEYGIRPNNSDVTYSPLHEKNTFVFLNALGGWDAFNFDAASKEEMRPDIETYSKTVTPDVLNAASPLSVETVYLNDAEELITIEGAPVSKIVGEWLREMVKSKVIYHNDKYVIVQEYTVTDNPDAASLVNPTIKFKYSDKWQL